MSYSESKESLQYLVGLGETKVIDVNGQKYSTKQLFQVKDPKPAAIRVSTLTALVNYLKNDIDTKVSDNLLIHVASPNEVALYSELRNDCDRETYIFCEALLPDNIVFDSFIDTERFNIMLQSSFVNRIVYDEESDKDLDFKNMLLQITGRIKDDVVKEIGDDGISQAATIKTGVASVNNVKVPNPVILAPYRTFPEIEQPASKFIFRMRSGPSAALYEADGGAWRNEAMQSIKTYLEDQLQGLENIKIIS